MSEESKALLRKAVSLLIDNYELDEDCFFVVVTKDGKNPSVDVEDQKIVGEINLKTLVAFMVRATYQLCGSVGMDPHVFISRYVTGAILAQEREEFFGFGVDLGEDECGLPGYDDDEDDEELELEFFHGPHWTDIEN